MIQIKPKDLLFSNITEINMAYGDPYKPNDPELAILRRRTQRILRDFNNSVPHNPQQRLNIFEELVAYPLKGECEIEPPFYCDYGTHIKVGKNFYANFDCIFLDSALITIGDNVTLGPKVQIYTVNRPLDSNQRREGWESALPVNIGNNVFIGGSAIILPGVTIGDGSVIAAGSVINSDIPPMTLAAGNPGKIIHELP